MSGWIKLHRKITTWEWWDDHNTTRLFIYLITKANHKDKKWRGIEIKRGQLLTSLDRMSKETGLTLQKIRTGIKRLKSTHEITSTSTSTYTKYIVEKYDLYQYDQIETNTSYNKPPTIIQQTNNKRITTTKNEKNVKNEKKINTNSISISKREKEFRSGINIYKNKYAPKLLIAFADHWTEPSHSGRKMKYEMEKTFEIGRRLSTWARNDFEGFQKEWIRENYEKRHIKDLKEREAEAELNGDTNPEEFKKFFNDIKLKIGKKIK